MRVLEDPDAERAILGGVLRFNDLLQRVEAQLSPEDLASRHHREIYEAMRALGTAGLAIDLTTLSGELQRRGVLPAVGGKRYLATLIDHGLSRNLDSYIARVREASLRRRLRAAAEGGGNAGEVNALVRELDTLTVPWEPPTLFHQFRLPPFPVSAFPGWLGTYLEALAKSTQTPVDLAAMLSLSVIAAVAAKKVVVLVKPGYTEPVNVFTVTTLAPGNRKSAVCSEVVAPLQEHEERETERLSSQIAEEASRRTILEQRLHKAEADAARAKPEDSGVLTREALGLAQELARLAVPTPPRFLADDTSPERLSTLLRDQGGRMAIVSPEGDIFDLMAGKYSASNAPNFGVFLKGHAGDTLRVDRVNRPTEYVKNPALTLGLAVQPEVLRGLVDKPGFRGRGLLARFLYSVPESLLGRRATDPPDVSTSVRFEYRRRIDVLLRLPFDVDQGGQPTSHILHLSAEARHAWLEFAAWLEPQLGSGGELGTLTDWAGKLPGAVARLAGILHLAAHATDGTPWALPISRDTVEDAIAIGRYLIPHARAAFAEMGVDPVVEEAKQILAWILRKQATTFTKRDVFQGTKGRFKRVEGLTEPLGVLVDHGFIRQLELAPRPGPGRRASPAFEVNPHLLGNSEDCGNSGNQGEDPGEANFEVFPSVVGEGTASPAEPLEASVGSHNSHNPQNSATVDSDPVPPAAGGSGLRAGDAP